jgi:hypothetical protein
MSTEPSERTRELRDLLVATATVNGHQRQPRFRKTAIAAVAAFALAGALTGGAISGVAIASTTPPPSAQEQKLIVEASSSNFDGTFLGAPIYLTGQGDKTVDLGTRPPKANAFVVSFWCLNSGKYVVAGNSLPSHSLECSSSKAAFPSISEPTSFGVPYSKSTSRTWTVSTDSSHHWAVWISWTNLPSQTKESVQQKAEVADGTVTRQEYLDAYSRYQGCLAQAGYPSLEVLDSQTFFDTGSSGAGGPASDRCYTRELQDVDTLWQTENPQIASGYSPSVMSYCLTKLGQTPASTAQGMLDQLNKLEINPIDCTPVPRD